MPVCFSFPFQCYSLFCAPISISFAKKIYFSVSLKSKLLQSPCNFPVCFEVEYLYFMRAFCFLTFLLFILCVSHIIPPILPISLPTQEQNKIKFNTYKEKRKKMKNDKKRRGGVKSHHGSCSVTRYHAANPSIHTFLHYAVS